MKLDNAAELLLRQIEILSAGEVSVGDVKSLCASLKTIREISSDEMEEREQIARIKALEKSSETDSANPRLLEVVFSPEAEECSV